MTTSTTTAPWTTTSPPRPACSTPQRAGSGWSTSTIPGVTASGEPPVSRWSAVRRVEAHPRSSCSVGTVAFRWRGRTVALAAGAAGSTWTMPWWPPRLPRPSRWSDDAIVAGPGRGVRGARPDGGRRRDEIAVRRWWSTSPTRRPGSKWSLTSARARRTPGRVICVFGCGGRPRPGQAPGDGRGGDRLADVVVLTSDNPRERGPAGHHRRGPGGHAPARADAGRGARPPVAIEPLVERGRTRRRGADRRQGPRDDPDVRRPHRALRRPARPGWRLGTAVGGREASP